MKICAYTHTMVVPLSLVGFDTVQHSCHHASSYVYEYRILHVSGGLPFAFSASSMTLAYPSHVDSRFASFVFLYSLTVLSSAAIVSIMEPPMH